MPQVNAAITVVGLGNPAKDYQGTRHNTGREVLEYFRRRYRLPPWREDKKRQALLTTGQVGGCPVTLLCPETMMNRSGESMVKIVKSKKAAAELLVVHDDLDLPLGRFKISFGRGAGGHRGVESIIRKLKTKDFIRLRIGITPVTAAGKLKKPAEEKAVVDFILGKYQPAEAQKLKRFLPRLAEALAVIITSGRQAAMNRFN